MRGVLRVGVGEVKERLLDLLACPECGSEFEVNVFTVMEEIKEGELICRSCGRAYPIKNYIPRFVKTDGYVDTFSFEWYKHKTTQLDSRTGRDETEKTFKFDLNKIKKSLLLDAGCGVGRFMEIALKYGAEVVGVDLSFAVDAAQENLGFNKNAHIIQADIFRLPFKKEIFDKIFSIGVLHHAPDTREAFARLLPFLKKEERLQSGCIATRGHI